MICSTLSRWDSLSRSRARSSPKPRIAFRGVRNSWLTLESASLLAILSAVAVDMEAVVAVPLEVLVTLLAVF